METKAAPIARVLALFLSAAVLAASPALADEPSGEAPLVTPDNFRRAESDMYFAAVVKDGGFARFYHHRDLMPIEKQTVIRSNRDTLYSAAVFDLDAGPVTITLPDAGRRFMSLQVIDEDQYTHGVYYAAGAYTLTRGEIGTRYVLAAARTLVDPTRPKDVDQVHLLQDAIAVELGAPGTFDPPAWDVRSQKRGRDALLALGETIPDTRRMFGPKDRVDPVRHLVGTAMAWGGNPEQDALYLTVTPEQNDGSVVHKLRVRDVPVDGFWSVSVYDSDGYFVANAKRAYTLNDLSAARAEDGTVTVQFGGCDGPVANCLPIVPKWNYTVRLYRPRAEILDGTWSFPKAEPAP